jgi:hypothetical protein
MSKESNGALPMALIGISLGLSIGNIAGSARVNAEKEHSRERVEAIQHEYADIENELEKNGREVGSLILKDLDKTFTYNISTDGKSESCNGHYTVEQNTAKVAGDIACTYTVSQPK